MPLEQIPVDIKVRCVDLAIKVVKQRQRVEKLTLSCPRLYWSTAEVLSGAPIVEVASSISVEIRDDCNEMINSYRDFVHNVYRPTGKSPYWWNGDGYVYYNERIAALTAFKQYLTEQGE